MTLNQGLPREFPWPPGCPPRCASWPRPCAPTPAVLLGAGHLERLSPAECHQLLAPRGIGRIAFTTASGLMVLPVNYAMADGAIVIRTDGGSVIAVHGDGPVSFQVDHFDLDRGQGWSVLVRGDAHRPPHQVAACGWESAAIRAKRPPGR